MQFIVDDSGNVDIIHSNTIDSCFSDVVSIDDMPNDLFSYVDHCFGTSANGNLLVLIDGKLVEILGPWRGIC